MSHIFRSLKHRNLRVFIASQSVSLIGTWMQQVAVSWLVYRLTRSAFLLGAVNFISLIPTLILSPVAGSLIDRFNRRRLVLTTQILFLAQALAMTVLILSGHAGIFWIMALSLLFGIICVFDIPARQAFLVDMIDEKEDLPNAIAIHSIMFNSTRIVGPALAGILIAARGEGVCFIVNTLSYLAPILVLLRMSTRTPGKVPDHSLIDGMIEGFRYLKSNPELKNALILLALMSFAGMPYAVLMPIFAKDILRGGSDTMGFLMAATGAGALLGAFYLAYQHEIPDIGRKIRASCVLFGLSVLIFAWTRSFCAALFFMFLAGFGMMIQMNLSNILLQIRVEELLRGRMMSFYTMAFLGVTPFGGLLAGIAAAKWGATLTTASGGLVCVAAAALISIRPPDSRPE